MTVRPMTVEDAEAVAAIAERAFADLSARFGRPPQPAPPLAAALMRIRHLLRTDPGGAWFAERDGAPAGAALALLREGVWGLSLLVVDPAAQSGGVGSELLARALDYGGRARGGIILASEDSRALRAYARAGFDLHPVMEARGVPRPLAPPDTVRAGRPDDLPLTETVDRAVRGAAHGSDIGVMLAQGAKLLVVPGRGYVACSGGDVRLLAALDEDAARDLLTAALAQTPEGTPAGVDWLAANQQWAVPVALEAGLELRPGGAVFVRGDVGPFSPYLPSGAYL